MISKLWRYLGLWLLIPIERFKFFESLNPLGPGFRLKLANQRITHNGRPKVPIWVSGCRWAQCFLVSLSGWPLSSRRDHTSASRSSCWCRPNWAFRFSLCYLSIFYTAEASASRRVVLSQAESLPTITQGGRPCQPLPLSGSL